MGEGCPHHHIPLLHGIIHNYTTRFSPVLATVNLAPH